MTDNELFLKSLASIKNQMLEERSEITRTDELNSQIAAEYDEGIEILNRIIPKIKEVEDVWSLDEEDFIYVLTCFEAYCEAFTIDGTDPEKMKADEEEFSQLQDVLFQFYDEDEDESEEDDEDFDDEDEIGDEADESDESDESDED